MDFRKTPVGYFSAADNGKRQLFRSGTFAAKNVIAHLSEGCRRFAPAHCGLLPLRRLPLDIFLPLTTESGSYFEAARLPPLYKKISKKYKAMCYFVIFKSAEIPGFKKFSFATRKTDAAKQVNAKYTHLHRYPSGQRWQGDSALTFSAANAVKIREINFRQRCCRVYNGDHSYPVYRSRDIF